MKLGDLTPNTCLQATGIFIIIKNTDFSKIWGKYTEEVNMLLISISQLSYGIYLSNILIIKFLEKAGLLNIIPIPLINIPIMMIVVFIFSPIVLIRINRILIITNQQV